MNNDKFNSLKVNMACGDIYVDSWTNFDYQPHSRCVNKVNLLSPVPIDDSRADIVYSSHFLEHIPRVKVRAFLAECFRILKPGGTIRLVTPDLQELCNQYLYYRDKNEHDKADFIILEMLDQCVRLDVGGDLGLFFESLPQRGQEMANFVFERTGFRKQSKSEAINRSLWVRGLNVLRHPHKMIGWLETKYIHMALYLLPTAFRVQNISLAYVGERHMWIYDYSTLSLLLADLGFVDVARLTFDTSRINDFPIVPLDMTTEGTPRKGRGSMYIEARRPVP